MNLILQNCRLPAQRAEPAPLNLSHGWVWEEHLQDPEKGRDRALATHCFHETPHKEWVDGKDSCCSGTLPGKTWGTGIMILPLSVSMEFHTRAHLVSEVSVSYSKDTGSVLASRDLSKELWKTICFLQKAVPLRNSWCDPHASLNGSGDFWPQMASICCWSDYRTLPAPEV